MEGCPAELISLGRVLAKYDRPVVVHMRSESDLIQSGVEEMLEVGRQSGCRVHISHLKIAGKENWHLLEWMLKTFDRAEAEGIRLTADQYPYTAGSTMMGAILPPWAHDGGFEQTLARLDDPTARAKMKVEIMADGPHSWDNFFSWGGPDGVVISNVVGGDGSLTGKTLTEAAGGGDPVDFVMDLLRDARLGVGMIAFSGHDDVVSALMAHPKVNGCTDGLLHGKPHPRAYGSFPRILGRYVRDQGICSLPEAVRKLTSQAAEAMTLRDRGRVAEGLPADLVVFDPATVLDTATYAKPRQYPQGMPHVMVAGELVVRGSKATGARPGKVIRG